MTLQISLLGPPFVSLNGAPPPNIKVLRRRERAALFLLAATDTPLPSERLLDLLWPEDTDINQARKSLHPTISRLKRILPSGALQHVSGGYHLQNHPDLFIDYREFLQICNHELALTRHLPPNASLPGKIVARLRYAKDLWRGAFLEGFKPPKNTLGFDNWLINTSNFLERHYQEILTRLARHHFAQQEYAATFQLCKTLLEQNPDQPEILLLALRALRLQDLIASASQFLDAQREHMMTYSGADYPEHILKAAKRLVQQPPENQPAAHWSPHPTLKAPFIGRENILAELKHQASKGGALLLLGETGQGKTRLLKEFAQQMQDSHRLVHVVCHYGEHTLPFAPLIEAIRRAMRPDEWAQVAEAWWPYLLHLIPDIEQHLPPVTIHLPPAPLQHQLMQALRQTLLVMARHTPLIVSVDDAQWSDPATVDTLLYWMEHPPFKDGSAFLLIAARRETFHTSPLGQKLIPLTHERKLPMVELSGLSVEDVATLAQIMLRRKIHPNEAESLWRASIAGTPLYLLETLRFQIEAGHANKPVHQWPLSQPLLPLLEQRLHYLTEDARTVLEYATLQESSFSWLVLKEALPLSDEQLMHALEMLEDTRWLRRESPDEEHPTTYTFVHHKLREVVTKTMSPARRQHIHKQLAKAWQHTLGQATQSRAAVIAFHHQQAGEYRLALTWWIKAAHHALTLGAARPANEAFRNAARLITLVPHLFTDEEIWRLYAEWALLAYDTSDIATLKHIAQSLQILAEERQSSLLRSSLLNAQAYLYQLDNRMADGAFCTRQALDWLELLPKDVILPRIEVHTHHARLLYLQARAQEATQHLQTARRLSEGQDNTPLAGLFLGTIHYQLATINVLSARPDLALQEAEKSLKYYLTSRRVFGVADAMGIRGKALFMLGRYQEALQSCQEAIERAAQFQKKRILATLYSYCAFPLHALGRLKEAWEATEQALTISEEVNSAMGRALALRARGDIFFLLEDWPQALNHYLASLNASSDLVLEADVRFRAGVTMAHVGDPTEALTFIKQADEQQQKAFRTTCLLIPLAYAEVKILQNRPQEALALLDGLFGKARALQRIEVMGGIYLLQARAHIKMEDYTTARRLARALVKLGNESQFHWLQRWGLEILSDTGETTTEDQQQLQQIYQHLALFRDHPALGASITRLLQERGFSPEPTD